MSMFDFYAENQAKGFPGMKANTTVDTVDSFASEGGVNPGEPVVRGTDPEKQVKTAASTEGAKVIGIAVHTHKEPNEGGKYYEEGYSVPVMTSGDVYVEAGSDVTAGDEAAIDVVSGNLAFVAKDATGDTTYRSALPNVTFMENGSEGDIVRVRIRN